MTGEAPTPFDGSVHPYSPPRSSSANSVDYRLFGPQRYRAVPWTLRDVILLAPMVIGGIWRGLLVRTHGAESSFFVSFNVVAVLLLLTLPLVLVVFRDVKLYQMGLHASHCWRNALAGFLCYFLAAPVVALTNLCALRFFQRTPHKIENLLQESHSASDMIQVAISAIVIAPIIEELAFRGILQPWLRRVAGSWPSIVLTSAIFAIAHFDAWPAPIALFVLALFLGYLAHRTTSLVAPMILHAVFNGVNLAILILALVTHTLE